MRLNVSTEQQVFFNILKGVIPADLGDVDLDQLFLLFQRHRLFPLAPVIIQLLDDSNREKWRNEMKAGTIKSLHYFSVLTRITEGFRKEGITAIPLKGPVLAHDLYGAVGDRHFIDLDILIQGVDISRVIECARNLGLTLRSPKEGLTANQWKYYFKYKYDVSLVEREQGVFVEVHTSINKYQVLNHAHEHQLWENREVTKIGGSSFHCLNHENTFLYLVYHGGMHQYFRLSWLRDVAEILKKWDLNHRQILQRARSLEIGLLLGVGLELALYYFDVKTPPEYQDHLERNSKRIRLLRDLCRKCIQHKGRSNLSGKLNRQLYLALLKPGFQYRGRIIWRFFHRWYIRKFYG